MSQDVKDIFVKGVSQKQNSKQNLDKNITKNDLATRQDWNLVNQQLAHMVQFQQVKNNQVENIPHRKDQIISLQQKQNPQLKRNSSLEQQIKQCHTSVTLQGNLSQDQFSSQKMISLKEKVQSQLQQYLTQPNSQNLKTQSNFQKKSVSQFEINLSQLNIPIEVQYECNNTNNHENNFIDFSRFKKKEIGQKIISQSQLLFDQLRKKKQDFNLSTQNEIGRKEDQLVKKDNCLNQNQYIQSERQYESDQCAFSLNNLFQKAEELSSTTDAKQLQKTQPKFFRNEQDFSPYKKINGSNKKENQNLFRYSLATELSSVRNNSENTQSINNMHSRNITQLDLSHKRVIQNVFAQQKCLTQNDSTLNTLQKNLENNWQKQESQNHTQNLNDFNIKVQNQTLKDKFNLSFLKNSKDEMIKIDQNSKYDLQNQNNFLSQNMTFKSQQEIQNIKAESKRSDSIKYLQDNQFKQQELENMAQSSKKNNSQNQLIQRLKNDVQIIVPQNQFRNIYQGSSQKQMNQIEQDTLKNNHSSSTLYQKNCFEQSPIILNKIRTSQFKQKSQILFPQVYHSSEKQEFNSQQTNLQKFDNKKQSIIQKHRRRVKPCEFSNSKNSSNNIQNYQSLNLERDDSQKKEDYAKNNTNILQGLDQTYKQQSNNNTIQNQYLIASNQYRISLSAIHKQQQNHDSEDENISSMHQPKNNSFKIPLENNTMNSIKNINSIRHNHSKSKFEKSQISIEQLDISPISINKFESSSLNFNLGVFQQQHSLRNLKQFEQNDLISPENINSCNSLQRKQVDMKSNKIDQEGRLAFCENELRNNFNKSILNQNRAKKFCNNQSFHSSQDFSPAYSYKSKDQAQSGQSNNNQSLASSEKIQTYWFIYNQIIDFFSYQQLKKYKNELQNIQFRSQTFYDFIKNIIFNDIEDNQQVGLKQKANKKDQNLKFSYIKEHIKLIGITPNMIPLITEEIKEKLNELVQQSQNDKSQFQINESSIIQIQENFNYYLKQNIHWTLLDEFGTENDLLSFSKQLYQTFLLDPLCLKCLMIFQIDEVSFNQIILSAFQRDYIEENLKEEIKKRVDLYLRQLGDSQDSNLSYLDLTYADFFYIKYKFMYFCLEKSVNLKLVFAILETIEKLRFIILKKPQSIDSINYETIGFQLRSRLQNYSQYNQIATENSFSNSKLEQIFGNLVKCLVAKSICFYPFSSLPQQINALFSYGQEFTVQLSNQILTLLQRDYKCEKSIILDTQLALSTIKIASGVKQPIINTIFSNHNLNFETLLNKLLQLLDENQIFTQYTSLSNPINLKLFIINLLCFLFDIFIDEQPCRIYTLDLKAQFKMFGCNFVAYNDFLIQVQNFLKQFVAEEQLQDFILNSCRDLKGLDIFD
ncbi:hypothetical protein TTHERM_00530480 (macronuclear) [Tetrahymena thermophila SB210]|uniref:Uncharacterized protein n=1 Tax=Tetrahymena thermophila (strain SB210) TaxID=312017 RepID=I7MGE7_TETTS|nr:hypothetical protein TTHERM_00530480 [Tetrahymena thermophila SB210]EAR85090.2 hypothetical protein TTHERM_00530480 [Tetrahymena thermophila SB210]|eukprot:XP_001032753.2 hypothetical protein TTHERM_00530480 [Tetrahymena thermophila SB210]